MGNDRTEVTYKGEVARAMRMLADDPRTIFIGQNTIYPGNSIFLALKDIPNDRKIETPVFEETQMGMSIGLALAGLIPVSVYSRFDFLILATNQIVNHLDKMEAMTHGQFTPKVIIRTIVGSTEPFDPGLQHCQDHSKAFRELLTNCDIREVRLTEMVMTQYQEALASPRSSLMVEYEAL